MTITEQIIHLSDWQFGLFFCLAVAVCVAGFYVGFRSLRRARVIENTPTAKIKFAQQGYVELDAAAAPMKAGAIPAPLTGTDCCWYRFKVEKKGNKNWRVVEKDTSDCPFLLRDETGECVLEPQGAEVTTADRNVWYGSTRYPEGKSRERWGAPSRKAGGWVDILNKDLSIGGRYRYTEERIRPGELVYAIGQFKSLDDIDFQTARRERSGRLLREWKRDHSGLLKRFDRDGDGKIDTYEWEKARQAALHQAGREQQDILSGMPAHTLGATGSRRRPFLLSTLPQFDLVRRFRLMAAGSLAAFFVAGVIAAWMFGTRFSG